MQNIAMTMAMQGSVRIWKCTQVQPYQSKDFSAAHPTQDGEYYEWQKMKNIDIHIRRTWKAQNDWQMLTKNTTEQNMLAANDGPRVQVYRDSLLKM